MKPLLILLLFSFPQWSPAQSDRYQYQIVSDPPGAAVFVGNSYKGVTPYTSAVVTAVPNVTYQVVAGGFKAVTVPITGTPDRLSTATITLEETGNLDDGTANLILEAIRSELSRAGTENEEIAADFSRVGPYLTADFKDRLRRMARASKTLGKPLSRLPAPESDFEGSQTVWSVHEKLHEDPENVSWMGSCIETFDGESGGGYGLIYAFSREGTAWRLTEIQEIGQDFGDEESEN